MNSPAQFRPKPALYVALRPEAAFTGGASRFTVGRVTGHMSQRVVVGMSGGVDSSTAVAVLLRQGFEVIGVTLKLWPQECADRMGDKCCGPDAVMDARTVAAELGIKHYVINEAEDFQKHVIQYFADEYKAGRTPNPCIMCNEHTKFGALLRCADQLDAAFVGHRPLCAG